MIRNFVGILFSLIAAVCGLVALYCPWGFLCAFEPGQEAWRIRFPVIFAVALVLCGLSTYFAARTGFNRP